jgi:hypothetical protein
MFSHRRIGKEFVDSLARLPGVARDDDVPRTGGVRRAAVLVLAQPAGVGCADQREGEEFVHPYYVLPLHGDPSPIPHFFRTKYAFKIRWKRYHYYTIW